jgi:hypothetical protein
MLHMDTLKKATHYAGKQRIVASRFVTSHTVTSYMGRTRGPNARPGQTVQTTRVTQSQ